MSLGNLSMRAPQQVQVSPTVLETISSYTIVSFGVGFIILSSLHYYNLRKRDVDVPAIGVSGHLSSYYSAFKFLYNARSMLQEGYAKVNFMMLKVEGGCGQKADLNLSRSHIKYKGKTFKVPMIDHWSVVVSKPELIDEVRKAPDDKLSFDASIDDLLAIEYTLGNYVLRNKYHTEVIRSQLTRNIASVFNEIYDEIEHAFNDCVNLEGSAWKAFPVLEIAMQIVCRTSNRVFVGLPLCRNEDYIDLNINFAVDVAKASRLINLFPMFLRGIVGNIFTPLPKSTWRALKHLKPLIEAHLEYEVYGNGGPEKSNDLLAWLIDAAQGEQKSVVALTQRVLTVNFAAIHTSSKAFTYALSHLAELPEYIQPLREEVESVIKQDGWTKLAMQKMRKLDSFMKEAQRVNSNMMSMRRIALVNYTLSDGTYLPKGTHVACNAFSVHHEAANYPKPDEFDGFRFAKLRAEVDGESAKNHLVATSNEYLTFSHGRHACPGRFFAANELKAMMAYLVMHYDVKLEDGETERPKNFEFGPFVIPNPKAKVMFRKRQN